MSQSILIVPAGEFQVPAINAARARGLRVVTADADANAPGIALADDFEVVNPSDAEALLRVARTFEVDAIASIASDPCVIPCAVVAEALGLPGLPVAVARRARNKLASMARLREKAPSLCPRFELVNSSDEAANFGFPFVLKPQAANGSKGVSVVRTRDDLDHAFAFGREYGNGLPLLAVEFLEGPEVSVETWSIDGDVHVLAVVDKMTTSPPQCVEVGHTTPSRLASVAVEALSAAANIIVKALGIENGPAHTELFMTGDGPRFVETGARLGGGCIASHLVPLSTGTDLVAATLDAALGSRPDLEGTREGGAAIRFLQPQPGNVSAIRGLEEAASCDGVADVQCRVEVGDVVEPLMSSDQRAGYVIAEGATAADAASRADAAAALIVVETSEG